MTKNVLNALFNAARGLLRNFGALLALAILYAALLAAAVLFVTTREASVVQLGLTALAAVALPVLFFLLVAACASYAAGESRPFGLMRGALRNFLKVLALSIPVLALVVGTVWGLNKLESRVKIDPQEEARFQNETHAHEEDEADDTTAPHAKPPVRWAYVFYSALRLFLLGFVLPLIAIHLWIVAARDGLKAALLTHHRTIARALSARSVFTYALGMIVFALVPYFFIIKQTPSSTGWLELSFLSTRLVVAFALTLFGFVSTVAALARIDGDATNAPSLVPQTTAPAQPRTEMPATVAGQPSS
ncbi:MAG: hypothetical protein QOE33_2095 [Acidobacteriota bacterium]|nr:hypothetical protein [Acidobacteriota bacterium]